MFLSLLSDLPVMMCILHMKRNTYVCMLCGLEFLEATRRVIKYTDFIPVALFQCVAFKSKAWTVSRAIRHTYCVIAALDYMM